MILDLAYFDWDWKEFFAEFLEALLESHLNETSNEGNTFIKMKHYWEYFSTGIEDGMYYYKKFKKVKNIKEYQEFISDFSE